jgi:transcriptional regulator with XRE-family HTH domain
MTNEATDDMKRMQLARRLREAREYVGLSQEDVAFALAISRPAVGNIEAGNRKVEAVELTKLSSLYGQTIEYFLGEEVQSNDKRVAFLARAIHGLSERDIEELTRFATFLRSTPKAKGRTSL